jgi:hypothetical protein
MRTLTKILATSALAAASLSFAAGAHASTIFANLSANSNGNTVQWTNDGAANSGSGGTLSSTNNDYSIKFFDGSAAGHFLDAVFTITATATNSPATFDGATYSQLGLDSGSFTIIAASNQFGVTVGENLLSGTFNDAWIQGAGTQGGLALTLANGGTATFTSAYENFSQVVSGSEGFTLTLGLPEGQGLPTISTDPGLPIPPAGQTSTNGRALESFGANLNGTFNATMGAVPEPATWGLMIMGFGGMGVMLRNRRRMATAA